MTREEFLKGIKYIEESNSSTKIAEHLVHAGEYIKSLEQQNAELQARIKELEEVNENYGNTILELINKVKKLQEPKKCFDCKDKYDCYSYGTLTEDQTYMMSCPAYEPKQ